MKKSILILLATAALTFGQQGNLGTGVTVQSPIVIVQANGSISTNEVLAAGTGISMTRAAGTNTIASTASGSGSIEYGQVILTNAQSLTINQYLPLLMTNQVIAVANTSKVYYETNSSGFRTLQDGKWEIFCDGIAYRVDAYFNEWKNFNLYLQTNSGVVKGSSTFGNYYDRAVYSQVFIPIISLASNTLISPYYYHSYGGTMVALTNSGTQIQITMKWLGE